MIELVEHIAEVRGIGLHATGTTDQREALEGADYVVVCISTGALQSMALDIAIPERYGIKQSVGDTVGPGGIVRALRNIPVMVDIARDMEQVCPDAWMLNLTNPMTTLTRSVLRETSITAVGLCHEVTLATFVLSLLLECDMRKMKLEISGVNHLPIITKCEIEGKDGLAMLADMLEHEDDVRREPIAFNFAEMMGHEAVSEGRRVDQGPAARPQPGEVRDLPPHRRVARRRRPPPRRVLLRLPHRGVALGPRLGRAAHRHGRAGAVAGQAHRRLRGDARGARDLADAVG